MNCLELSKQIEILENRIFVLKKLILSDQTIAKDIQQKEKTLAELKKKYAEGNCDVVLGDVKTKETLELIQKYQNIDKERIEAESKHKERMRIFFGALVIASFVVIIATYKKK